MNTTKAAARSRLVTERQDTGRPSAEVAIFNKRLPGPGPVLQAERVSWAAAQRWPRIEAMRIVSIGGGPAGLYFSLLMKKADPGHDLTVVERNRADDTFGFGVVFSDATLDTFIEADRPTGEAITRAFAHCDDIDIHYQAQLLTSTGHGFSGLSRQALLDILQRRCAD